MMKIFLQKWGAWLLCAVSVDRGPRSLQLLLVPCHGAPNAWLPDLQRYQPQVRTSCDPCYSRQNVPPAHCQRRFVVIPQLHLGGQYMLLDLKPCVRQFRAI
jgi:hypothetical protein